MSLSWAHRVPGERPSSAFPALWPAAAVSGGAWKEEGAVGCGWDPGPCIHLQRARPGLRMDVLQAVLVLPSVSPLLSLELLGDGNEFSA